MEDTPAIRLPGFPSPFQILVMVTYTTEARPP
jgi:hypothetical protein